MALLNKSPFVFSILLALSFSLTQASTFEITNNCSYTVWPASLPSGGGRQLNPGETWSLDVVPGTDNGSIWGRTGCNFNGSAHCDTGDCGGMLHCQLSGTPPTTLAQFSLYQRGLDYYRISVVDGFNIPMEFSPTTNNCTLSLLCLEDKCPDAYHDPNEGNKYHNCPGKTNYKIVFCPCE